MCSSRTGCAWEGERKNRCWWWLEWLHVHTAIFQCRSEWEPVGRQWMNSWPWSCREWIIHTFSANWTTTYLCFLFALSCYFNFLFLSGFTVDQKLEFKLDWHVIRAQTLKFKLKGNHTTFLPPWVWENCQGLRALYLALRGNVVSRVNSPWIWSVRRWVISDILCMLAVVGTCLVTLPSLAIMGAPGSREVRTRQTAPRQLDSSHAPFGMCGRTLCHGHERAPVTCHLRHQTFHPSSRTPSLCPSWTWTPPMGAYRGCCSPAPSAQQMTPSAHMVR